MFSDWTNILTIHYLSPVMMHLLTINCDEYFYVLSMVQNRTDIPLKRHNMKGYLESIVEASDFENSTVISPSFFSA